MAKTATKGVNPFAKKGSADAKAPVPPAKGAGKSGKCK